MMSGEKNVWAASTHEKVRSHPGRTKAFDCLIGMLQKDMRDVFGLVIFITLIGLF